MNSSVTTTMTVSETGDAELDVTSVSFSGANASEFTISSQTLAIADGGAAQPLTITCTPTATGLRTATMTVNHNAPGSPATYPLTCYGGTTNVPGYNSMPVPDTTIGVGSAIIGSSVARNLAVSETGDAELDVTSVVFSGINATEFSISSQRLTIADGGASQALTITCTPIAASMRRATMTVNHNAPGSPAIYTLSCYGESGPGLSITPMYDSIPVPDSTIGVGNAVVGSKTAGTLSVINSSNAELDVFRITFSGTNASEFSVSPATLVIAANTAPLPLTITCTPTATGLRTATMTVNHNTPGSPATYTVDCYGGITGIPVYESDPIPTTVVSLGMATVGSPVTRDITVSNTGDADLTITGSMLTGTDAARFSILPDTFTIAQRGASHALTVTCTPLTTDSLTATLTVNHNGGASPAIYELTCNSQAGYASAPVPGSTIGVGSIDVNSTVTTDLVISETGTSELFVRSKEITGTNVSDFSIDPRSFTIADGGPSQTETISCTPSATELRTATLTIDHNGQNSPAVYTLNCYGGTTSLPGYDSNPIAGSTIGVGSIDVNSSVTTDLTVSETGNADLEVTSILLTGTNSSEFSVLPQTFTIADGDSSREMRITCTPTVTGLRTATLTVNHNAPGSPAIYTLNCYGGTTGIPSYDSDPIPGSTIGVGSARVNLSSTSDLIVSETGDAALEVTSYLLTGTNASDFSVSSANFTIADGGGPQTMTITCTPSAAGLRTAILTVNHNAPGSPAIYTLDCYGILIITNSMIPGYGSDPAPDTTIGVGSADLNTSVTRDLTVSETGGATLKVTSAVLSGANASEFSVSPDEFTIVDGGSPQTMTITCTPTATGLRTVMLTVNHDAPNSPAEYTLNCYGGTTNIPGYNSDPIPGSTIGVGSAIIGASVSTNHFTISETGDAELDVTNITLSNPVAFSVSQTSLTIADGGSPQTLTITCSPIFPGLNSGTLMVSQNAPGSPATYRLECYGDTATIQSSKPVYDSDPVNGATIGVGNTNVGTMTSGTLTVSNTGDAMLNVTNAVLSGANASEFSVSPTNFSIASGGASQTVTITCTPAANGLRTAMLTLDHDAVGSPAEYTIDCYGGTTGIPKYVSDPAADSSIAVGAANVGSPVSKIADS